MLIDSSSLLSSSLLFSSTTKVFEHKKHAKNEIFDSSALLLFHALLSSFHRCQKIIININSLSHLSSIHRNLLASPKRRQQPATRKKETQKTLWADRKKFLHVLCSFLLVFTISKHRKVCFLLSLSLSAYLRCILISQLTTKTEFMLLLCVCCFWTHWNFFFLVRALQSLSPSHIHFSLSVPVNTQILLHAHIPIVSQYEEKWQSRSASTQSPD